MSVSDCWGITTYFNPQNYVSKRVNYSLFRKKSVAQGLKLLTVELALGNLPFVLSKGDAEILIQVRSKSVLWHKERLLNIALSKLPKDCKKIIWLDADVLFDNEKWVSQTSQLLDRYVVAQPYSLAVRLPKGRTKPLSNPHELPEGEFEAHKIFGVAYKYHKKIFNGPSMSGYAWAARRSLFDSIGFYDKMILGSGDSIMVRGFLPSNEFEYSFQMQKYAISDWQQDIRQWQEVIRARVQGKISYTPGTVYHLFHGYRKNRFYVMRLWYLLVTKFNPLTDLKVNRDECWEWKKPSSLIAIWASIYFWLRNEDDSFGKNFVCWFFYFPRKIQLYYKNKKINNRK